MALLQERLKTDLTNPNDDAVLLGEEQDRGSMNVHGESVVLCLRSVLNPHLPGKASSQCFVWRQSTGIIWLIRMGDKIAKTVVSFWESKNKVKEMACGRSIRHQT